MTIEMLPLLLFFFAVFLCVPHVLHFNQSCQRGKFLKFTSKCEFSQAL